MQENKGAVFFLNTVWYTMPLHPTVKLALDN